MTSLAALLVLVLHAPPGPNPGPPSPDPIADFEAWTGAKLVFTRDRTPAQVLYATTPALPPERRLEAAHILATHARNYPKGLFKKLGLKIVAVFAGCGDPEGDGFRPWVDELNGYRYFGRWHAIGAIAACFYEDGQLPLTFHHEVFHHIDATHHGVTNHLNFLDDDQRFREVVAGRDHYAPLALEVNTIASLRSVALGEVLEDAVGDYAQKSPGEDQAETARWLQLHLADGLLQAALRPELKGSQRILHLLAQYRSASSSLSPAWFVSVALTRAGEAR